MSIPALIDRLEEKIHKTFEQFERSEKCALQSNHNEDIFKYHQEMARIVRQFDYLHEWIDSYNKSRYIVKLNKNDH